MPRTVSPATQTAIQQPVTTPGYLIELHFSSILRLTTRGEIVTWNGFSWAPQGFGRRPVTLSEGRSGVQSGLLTFANHDNSFSALLLGEGCAGKRCNIWIIYGAGSIALSDATYLFFGMMDEARDIRDTSVQITIFSDNVEDKFSPHIKCTAPTFNHPSVNSRISWNGQVYELKRPDN